MTEARRITHWGIEWREDMRRIVWALMNGWEVEPATLWPDCEAIDGWKWTDPEGGEHTVFDDDGIPEWPSDLGDPKGYLPPFFCPHGHPWKNCADDACVYIVRKRALKAENEQRIAAHIATMRERKP